MKTRSILWPSGYHAAAAVTVELDGEYIWWSLDPACRNKPKVTSLGTLGIKRGLDRVLATLERYDVKATFFVPGAMAVKYRSAISDIAALDHEIALHGYEHENFGLLQPSAQRDAIARGIEAVVTATGKRPRGFRIPQGNMTPETMSIIQDAGFLYDSSLMDDDLPYLLGERENARLVEIPMNWENEDFTYFAFSFYPPVPCAQSRMSPYSDVLSIWKDELDGYFNYGLCYISKFDPQSIGTPGRIGLMDELLRTMREKPLWITTCDKIAEHCLTQLSQTEKDYG